MFKFITPHVCTLCEVRHEVSTPYTEEEFHRRHRSWREGELVQNAFPELSNEQRELLISGACQDAWNFMFGEEQEEDINEELDGVTGDNEKAF